MDGNFSQRDKRLLIRALILRLLGVGVTLNEALFPDSGAFGFPVQRDVWRDTVGEFVRQGFLTKEELTRQLPKEVVLLSNSEGDEDWLKEAEMVAKTILKLVSENGGLLSCLDDDVVDDSDIQKIYQWIDEHRLELEKIETDCFLFHPEVGLVAWQKPKYGWNKICPEKFNDESCIQMTKSQALYWSQINDKT